MELHKFTILSCRYAIHDKPFETRRKPLQYYLIRFQLEGSSRVTINGHIYEFHTGDLMVASPGDEYELVTGIPINGSPVRCTDYYAYCQAKDPVPLGVYPRKIHIGMDDSFINILKNIIYESRKLNNRVLEIEDYLTRLVFLYFQRYLLNTPSESSKEYLPTLMKNYIEGHATEPLTLNKIASQAGLGKSRASELFKEAFGISIMDYAIEVRLNIAKKYILFEQSSLEDIAYFSGFGSYTHFSRMFSKRFGVSPKKFREMNR